MLPSWKPTGRSIGCFLHTPVVAFEGLDRALGCRVLLKVETVNPIRSFKGRGADALLASIGPRPPSRLVCASAGNFGQGLAYAARARSWPITVYAARGANPLKLDAIRALGAEVVLDGADLDEAKHAAREAARAEGWTFLEDGAHDAGAAGAATMAKEMTDDGVEFDAILVPMGNGALVGGVGSWLRTTRPGCEVVAVAAAGAPAMERSWREGRAVEADAVDTVADGLAIRVPVPSAVTLMRETVDDVVLVSDEAMVAAMRLLHRETGLVAEPAGAAGVAAILEHPARHAGQRMATILCGSNVAPELEGRLLG